MRFEVVGVGEILWDLLPGGPVMGGAPANFAVHAAGLGAGARVISRVGKDEPGRKLLDCLEARGIPTEGVEVDSSLPTGTVSVTLNRHGEPEYVIHEPVAWDNLRGESPAPLVLQRADAVCFGTLAQRRDPSRTTIRSLLASVPDSALRILDLNLRQQFYSRAIIEDSLSLANVLKVNESELRRLAEMFELPGDEKSHILELSRRYRLRAVVCTRGEHGSLLFSNDYWSNHSGVRTKVADTIGAGDSFTAAMTLGMLAGWGAEEINQRANKVAAYVTSCKGATPEVPRELKAPFLAITPHWQRIR